MKEITKHIFVIFLSCMALLAYSQNEWVKVYGDNIKLTIFDLVESYDHGYLLGCHIKKDNTYVPTYGLLIKTDINGEVLWEKYFGSPDDEKGTDGISLVQTYDGGYITVGTTYKYDIYGDSYILKLNACGEKEWSKIFHQQMNAEYGIDIEQMNDSSFLYLISYWGNNLDQERIWLFNISLTGEINWQKVYANWNLQQKNNEECSHLIRDNENEYLITGRYNHPQPGGDTTIGYQRPTWIKVDSLGNEIWHTFYGIDSFFVGSSFESAFNSSGNIYSVGRNSSLGSPGDQAAMFKLNKLGNQEYTVNVPDNTYLGIATTISILGDTVLFIGSSFADTNYSDHNIIFKTDTLGTILGQHELLQTASTFRRSIITFDNKLLLTGSFVVDDNRDVFLWKFNKDLEYDSIYTQPRIYDSLCPYPIVSDTIDLDTTTVNLPELYKQMHRMKVRPNPASSKLYFTLGDLARGTEIRLYNTSGTMVNTLNLSPGQKAYEMDISKLPPGLYVAILLNMGSIQDKVKVVISR